MPIIRGYFENKSNKLLLSTCVDGSLYDTIKTNIRRIIIMSDGTLYIIYSSSEKNDPTMIKLTR